MEAVLNNRSGKVLAIFLIISVFLSASLAALFVFFTNLEQGKRKQAEEALVSLQQKVAGLENELKEMEKQKILLEAKYKEADDRINELADELELEEGLREEIKIENAQLKDQLDKEIAAHKLLKESLASVKGEYERKISDMEGKIQSPVPAPGGESLSAVTKPAYELGADIPQVLAENAPRSSVLKGDLAEADNNTPQKIELKEIVVAPPTVPDGRILSVDTDTEFVIINLGSKDGIDIGKVLSVFRGKDYLGDIKVTRVQSEMAAADFIPPFSSRTVRKNDQVVLR